MKLTDLIPPIFRRDLSQQGVPSAPIRGVAAQEHGVSGTENYGGYIRREDYNPDFDDWQKAVAQYDKMRRTDANVRAMLQVIKLPLRGATWQVNAASSDPVDKQIAEFCNGALFEDDSMDDSWDYTLRHILMQLEFGVSVLEKIWKVDEQGFYRFKRLAPRLPKTLREWHVNREGKLEHIVQYAPVPYAARDSRGNNRAAIYGGSVSYQYLTIPAEYCAVFVLDREGDNYHGMSLLRNIYRNWFFKDEAYRIMGVGLDRWGVGIPIIALEEGNTLSTGDLGLIREILRSVRANEKSYMVTPEHTAFRIEGGNSGQGTAGQFGISWIEHNDSQMARNVLAMFLASGQNNQVGTHVGSGYGSRITDMFISSLDGIANGINGDLKNSVIKPLCDFNFDMSRRKYPDPVCLDLEQLDLTALVSVLAQLQGTLITPQDDDEAVLRKMLGLPPLAPTRSREAKSEKAAQPGDASAVPQQGDGTNAGDATNPNRPGPDGEPDQQQQAEGGNPDDQQGGEPTPKHPGAPRGAAPPPHARMPPMHMTDDEMAFALDWDEGQHPRNERGQFLTAAEGDATITRILGPKANRKKLTIDTFHKLKPKDLDDLHSAYGAIAADPHTPAAERMSARAVQAAITSTRRHR